MTRSHVRALVPYVLVPAAIALCTLNEWLGPLLLVVVGAWSLRAWARRVAPEEKIFPAVVTVVFVLHVATAFALFSISYFQIPILRNLQVGGGFWTFAADSDGYHLRALAILDGLTAGQPPQNLGPTAAYELFLAIIYALFGRLPLGPIVINSWFVTAAGVIAAALARRWRQSSTGLYGSTLVVACWPSGFVWSSQLLRDCPAWFLTFGAIYGAVSLLDSVRLTRGEFLRKSGFLLLVGVGLSVTRSYAGWLLAGAAAVVLSLTLVRRLAVSTPMANAATVVLVLLLASMIGNGRFISRFHENVEIAANLKPLGDEHSTAAAPAVEEPASLTAPAGGSLVPLFVEQKRRELLTGSNATLGGGDLRTWRSLIAFLPTALATALFAPFPWEASAGNSTGVFKSLAVVESILLVLLSPLLVVGCVRAVRSLRAGPIFVFVYGTATLILLSLVIPNLGGLVRLRPQALLPLLVLACAFEGTITYRRLGGTEGVAALMERVTRQRARI